MVYAQINGDVLRGFSVGIGSQPSLTQVATGTSDAGYGGSLPIVSSNGATSGTGVVWLVRRGTTEQLEAYDAVALGATLFAANAGKWSNTSYGNSFVTAMEANGRVYVPAYKTVTVFGLAQQARIQSMLKPEIRTRLSVHDRGDDKLYPDSATPDKVRAGRKSNALSSREERARLQAFEEIRAYSVQNGAKPAAADA